MDQGVGGLGLKFGRKYKCFSKNVVFDNDTLLSKGPSDLKQNGKQEKEQFSSKAFHALQHGVVCFVVSVM